MTMIASQIRCGLLLCCAAILFSVGCQSTNNSTNNSSNAGGVAQNNGGSWSPYGPPPQKVQTTSDFVGLPRPQ